MKLNKLNQEEKRVILEKGTEAPFSGKYEKHFLEGIYVCRQCGAYLYRSEDKFDAHCGWPSFDDEIEGSIERKIDKDGIRTEIVCRRCKAHLGHIFIGEQLTLKNLRHCVNSISIDFIPKEKVESHKTIYLGGGCFWCIEAVFKMIKGVLEVKPGYAGGHQNNPNYEKVSSGNTGHAEVVKVVFDQTQVSLEKILSVFFDSHDPTTFNRQGNDVGEQYRSAIFSKSGDDLEIARSFIEKIKSNFEKPIVTEIKKISSNGPDQFFGAEEYHKDYYSKNREAPYCQLIISPKLEKIRKKYF